MSAVADLPVALIVEDVPTTLDTRKSNFRLAGFLAIGVSSKADALRELRSAPAIDIVVTDIGLNPQEPDKDTGVDLLHEVRNMRGDLPVIGYSARDLDDSLTRAPFNDFLGKADAWRIDEKIREWKELALRYRRNRATTARKTLERLQQKYKISNLDIEILRNFLPGSHLPHGEAEADPESADELLRRAGYRLGIIESQTAVPESGPPPVRIAVPVWVWVRVVPGAVVVELHGHPVIYGQGELDLPPDLPPDEYERRVKRAEKQAINEALELMHGYYNDIPAAGDGGPDRHSEEVKALREFLKKVFG